MKSLFIVLSFSACIPEINNNQAIDADGDGFTILDGDCDDQSSRTFPGAAYLDSSTDCMTDLDGDGRGDVLPSSEAIVAGTDCDDAQILSTYTDIDADCDNVLTELDCDDSNEYITTTNENDADCDGILTDIDCDDTDSNVIRNNVNDADCDGVSGDVDCDDEDNSITNSNENDSDCDGVSTGIDCNDEDNTIVTSFEEDADCDGILTDIDCDDTDSTIVSSNENDADCDGTLTSVDCDDEDRLITSSNENDADCDGVLSDVDCDDEDNLILDIKGLDQDCDGVLSDVDCDDSDVLNTNTKVADSDCDGVPTSIDCDDNDALVTDTNDNDSDCDGVLSDIDCNDEDSVIVNTNENDADCDLVLSSVDCNDTDALITNTNVDDTDCDTVSTAIDCNDTDASITNTNVDDSDCDGVLSDVDCNDEDSAIINTNENDTDCDLVLSPEDCNDNDSQVTNTNVDDADCDTVSTAIDCNDTDASITNTNVDDSDCDGIANNEDICSGGDDTVDLDGNGTPDDCDVICAFGDCDLSVDMGNGVRADFVLIDQLEDPLGRYSLSNSFYMMTTEVTQDMFQEVMGYDSRDGLDTSYGDGANFPAYYVSWHMAAHFANTLSESQGIPEEEWCYSCSGSGTSVTCSETMDPYLCISYSLPTEHEWEIAARSGTTSEFWTGEGSSLGGDYSSDDCDAGVTIQDGVSNPLLSEYAWFCGNSNGSSQEVGTKFSNGFGLYDMYGNLREWVADWDGCTYPNSGSWCGSGSIRVRRGGPWVNNPNSLGSSYHYGNSPILQSYDDGFRLRKIVVP